MPHLHSEEVLGLFPVDAAGVLLQQGFVHLSWVTVHVFLFPFIVSRVLLDVQVLSQVWPHTHTRQHGHNKVDGVQLHGIPVGLQVAGDCWARNDAGCVLQR